VSILRTPLITARHPSEGGAIVCRASGRRELLLRFLPYARYVDVELRSVKELRPVLEQARRKKIHRIISFRYLKETPNVRTLKARRAPYVPLAPAALNWPRAQIQRRNFFVCLIFMDKISTSDQRDGALVGTAAALRVVLRNSFGFTYAVNWPIHDRRSIVDPAIALGLPKLKIA